MIIGIDLGTTNCLAACFANGEPKLIPNKYGEYLTPSVVSIDENDQLFVGKAAKERKIKYPDQTVEVFKRSIGTEKEFVLGRQKMTAVMLSSIMLRSLKEDSEKYLGETVDEAIISVPAYFNELQRKATKEAGELAGIKVKRIINEPTAAALAYGVGEKGLDEVVMAFDLGGGTFDVSILEFFDGIVEVHAIAGDNYIGGEDFTKILMEIFCSKAGCDMERLSLKEKAHIGNQCENAKKLFLHQHKVQVCCNLGGDEYCADISLREYEKACQGLLEKMKEPIERSLKDSSFKLSEIDKVILIGGGTRLPIVQSFVAKMFKKFPDFTVNPDEAVALGAAIQCAMSRKNEAVKEYVLTDVCPFTLGTSVLRKGSGKMDDQIVFCPIIERNTVIPVSRTERFYTVEDNQTSVSIDILQGESRFVKSNLLLGTLNVKIPPAPAGEESILVTYTYDINSLLEVKIKVESTGKEKTMILQQAGEKISEEEARMRMKELDYLKVVPWEQEINKQVIFRGERLYEESLGDVRAYIMEVLIDFENVLVRQNKKEINECRKKVLEIFDEIEQL